MTTKKPELLVPAGTLEKLKMAVLYGADAVYLGGKSYGLRALGGNFTREELAEGVAFAHGHGARVYVTVNIIPRDSDFRGLPDYLRFLAEAGVDALLIADLGIFSLAREVVPELPIHVSTQANVTNSHAVKVWQQLGASRVVLARELSLAEIREIRAKTTAELEVFVHGAMCISYSGRCLLSSYFTGRDANRGTCAQSCRWRYALVEETRPGQYFPIAEDERGSYLLNSRDLCLLPYLPQLIGAGVSSLKIEGRMKSVHYVASVVKAYHAALDAAWEDPEHFSVKKEWREELEKVSHRPYTTGFFLHAPGAEDQLYASAKNVQTSEFVGLVRSYDAATGLATVEQRNHLARGEEIEIFPPTGEGFRQTVDEMYDEAGEPIAAAPHPQQIFQLNMTRPVVPYTILRRDKK